MLKVCIKNLLVTYIIHDAIDQLLCLKI